MLGIVLLVGLCILYVTGGIFFRKKGKPSIWNSLVFGCVVLLLAIIVRPNYLLKLPSLEQRMSVMFMIYANIPALVAGCVGGYMKETASYKWNTLFVRPVVLSLGFAGLVLPQLHEIPFMTKRFSVGIIPFTLGIFVVTVVEVVLNTIDKEYRMKLGRQIIYDFLSLSLNTLLVIVTDSIWLALISHGVYALCRWYRMHRLSKS